MRLTPALRVRRERLFQLVIFGGSFRTSSVTPKLKRYREVGTIPKKQRGTSPCLLVAQGRQRIDSGRPPCRGIAGENRGAQENDAGQREGYRIVGLGPKQKRFDQLRGAQRGR